MTKNSFLRCWRVHDCALILCLHFWPHRIRTDERERSFNKTTIYRWQKQLHPSECARAWKKNDDKSIWVKASEEMEEKMMSARIRKKNQQINEEHDLLWLGAPQQNISQNENWMKKKKRRRRRKKWRKEKHTHDVAQKFSSLIKHFEIAVFFRRILSKLTI